MEESRKVVLLETTVVNLEHQLEKKLQCLQDENGPHLEDKKRKEIEALENKCSRLLKAMEVKNVYLRQAKKDIKRLRQEIEDKQDGLMKELTRLQNENQEKEMKIDILLNFLQSGNDEKEMKIDLLEKELSHLQKENNEKEMKIDLLGKELNSLQNGIEVKEMKIDLLEKEKMEESRKVVLLETTVVNLEHQLEKKLQRLQDENGPHLEDKQRKEIEALENKCSRLLKAMDDKNVYLRQAKKDIKKLRQEIEDKQAGLMKELNRLQNENQEKEMKLDILLNLLQCGNDEKEMKIDLLEKEKMEESRKVVLLETTVANLEHHLETQERQGVVMGEEIVILKEDIARLEDEKKQLESTLALSRLELNRIVTQREGPTAHPNKEAPGISHRVEEEEEDSEPDSTAKKGQGGVNIEKEGRDTPKYTRLLSEIKNLKRGQKQLWEQLLEGRGKYEELESIALSLQSKMNRKRDDRENT
ncbi:thyroid receptor-interacting protein 11-like [Macrobrachium nipponense]|uniref:thyroid receptor-interacting protein 11-like n=1 Tax=Macrobrachium nipponense TaxID=159736 RepID=UPI0030C81427